MPKSTKASQKAAPNAKGPGLAKATIDLTKSDARKKLEVLYPRPASDRVIKASPKLDAIGRAYLARRTEGGTAEKAKTLAGNELCAAIGAERGIRGNGWIATWEEKDGTIDWEKLCEGESITAEIMEKYRKPRHRSLDVKATTDG